MNAQRTCKKAKYTQYMSTKKSGKAVYNSSSPLKKKQPVKNYAIVNKKSQEHLATDRYVIHSALCILQILFLQNFTYRFIIGLN